MTKYVVDFTRTDHTSIEVEAETEEEAEELANSKICNVDDYEWGCREIIVDDVYSEESED